MAQAVQQTREARKAFDEQLASLQTDLKDMGFAVEAMLSNAMKALADRNVELAKQVEDMDDIVDRYNLDIETKSLNLLALQQPMARDLRTIAAVMKIITDVERCGDYAVDIAMVAEKLADSPLFTPLEDIPRMVHIVQKMLRETLSAFVSRDLKLVQHMINLDEEVDRTYQRIYRELINHMKNEPDDVEQAVNLILIARYLERIADHITNIGERIYYMETGELKELHT